MEICWLVDPFDAHAYNERTKKISCRGFHTTHSAGPGIEPRQVPPRASASKCSPRGAERNERDMSIGKRLAREFMIGFRANLTCPDVSPSEYESVMARKIDEAVGEARGFSGLLQLAADQIEKARRGDVNALTVVDVVSLRHAARIAKDAM